MMIRKICLVGVSLLLAMFTVQADDNNVLRHYSLSVGAGTTGVTADVGTMVSDYLGLRGGVDYMPKITHSVWLDMDAVNLSTRELISHYEVSGSDREKYGIPEKVEVEGRYVNFTGHALLDIYLSRGSGFHFTVGSYFGRKDSKLVEAYNKEDGVLKSVADLNARRGVFVIVPPEYGNVAARLGSYNVEPDDQGNVNAYIKVNNIRPYVGLGFGRAVPKSSINCQVDLGVQFWGRPAVYNGVNDEQLVPEEAKGEDGGVLKLISDLTVLPVLSIRLAGRIF